MARYPLLVGFPIEGATIGFSFALIQIFFFFQVSSFPRPASDGFPKLTPFLFGRFPPARAQSTWALWIVSLSPSLGVIGNLLPFFLVSMEAFNGSLMPYAQMPTYYRWLYHVSPFQHYVRSMLGTLLEHVEVECAAFETVQFRTLPGQEYVPPSLTLVGIPCVNLTDVSVTFGTYPRKSCASYLASYLASNSGHVLNPTSTSTCTFCPLSNGTEFLATLNIDPATRYRSLGILVAYTVSNLVFAYAFVFVPPAVPLSVVARWSRGLLKRGGRVDDQGGTGSGSSRRRTAEQEAEEAWKLEGQHHSHQIGDNVQIHDPFS